MSRRTIIIIGVAVVVLLGAAGFSLAFAISHFSQGSASASVTPTPTATATTGSANGKNKKHNYTGVIQSIGSQSFVLAKKGKKSMTITVIVNNETKYSGPGGSASFSSLQVGETVEVRGTLDSQAQTVQATNIIISPSSGSATPTPTP